jgi:EAL domain-containing protein (putative c-di-GMP-specific phosphodiesterase class I)
VVADGVETQAQLDFLHAHQCDEAQGYFFSRPVLAEQFARLLETGMVVAAHG